MTVSNYAIYNRDEKPFGKTWEEWTQDWWRWALSIPRDENPGYDETGEKFNTKQNDSNVLFLVGTYGGSAERDFSVQYGKACLFPIINFTTSYSEEPFLKTEAELLLRSKGDIDDITYKEASIDGRKLQNLDKYRVASLPFDITLPENNVFGAKSGPTRAVSDGYWIFLKPLSPGRHTIHAAGSCSSGKTKVDVTWHITIKHSD